MRRSCSPARATPGSSRGIDVAADRRAVVHPATSARRHPAVGEPAPCRDGNSGQGAVHHGQHSWPGAVSQRSAPGAWRCWSRRAVCSSPCGSTLYEVSRTGFRPRHIGTLVGHRRGEHGLRHRRSSSSSTDRRLRADPGHERLSRRSLRRGFYGSTRVRFLDNYFLFVHPSTQQFYISAINDATSEDPLDFASAESSPDNLITLEVDHSEIWLFGEQTTEVWFDSGAADFPFQRNRGASIEIGCQAAHSVQKLDNSVFWIGQDVNGSGSSSARRASRRSASATQAVEQAFRPPPTCPQQWPTPTRIAGLSFYCLNAPGLTSTWCYEVSTGSWHERCDLDPRTELHAAASSEPRVRLRQALCRRLGRRPVSARSQELHHQRGAARA
jgi:hypothetical protein